MHAKRLALLYGPVSNCLVDGSEIEYLKVWYVMLLLQIGDAFGSHDNYIIGMFAQQLQLI